MSAERYPEQQVAITGIGQSEVARPSSRSALLLTMDACLAAIADAGLRPQDIDGVSTYPGKSSEGGGIAPVGPTDVYTALKVEPALGLSATHEGPGHLGAVLNAVMAIATGMCRHVLVFRTVAQASARQVSRNVTLLTGSRERVEGNNQWTVPFHAHSPTNFWALFAQAYFDKYGARPEQLGWVAVNGRRMAALNPNAVYRKPITIEDYLASRVISTPLRLLDCDSHVDGSSAFVLSQRDAAKDMPNPPIFIEALGVAGGDIGAGINRGDFTCIPANTSGEKMWQRTDLTPANVDCAQIYDGFSIHTLMWLEAVKLCGQGEAAQFVEGGERIGLGGQLPLNTSGGQLSQGRLHGYGHSYEACLQLWGRGGERQVQNAQTCVVANGGYGYGALLLRRD
jgi:acetyl-CoA acetyltransferase